MPLILCQHTKVLYHVCLFLINVEIEEMFAEQCSWFIRDTAFLNLQLSENINKLN